MDTIVELNPVAGVQEYVSPETDAAPINTLLPLHMDTSFPAFADGRGLIVTVTEFDLLHPVAIIVSVNTYVVVTVGFARGLETIEELNPVDGDHEYELPATDSAPMVVPVPRQMETLLPASAAGSGATVTVTVFDLVQPVPVIVSVSVYVVVATGDATGLDTVDELSPVDGDHR